MSHEVKLSRRRRILRKARVYFRRFRILLWSIILLLVIAVLYLNQVGLPDFMRGPLLAQLQARGIDFQFQRLRWRWHEGIVAEGVKFGRGRPPGRALSPRAPLDDPLPSLSASEVQVRLNGRQLARLKLQVDSLLLRRARVAWDLNQTNQPPRQLVINDIQTELHLLPNDEWRLDNLQADAAGVRLRVEGQVRNASALRDWKKPGTGRGKSVGNLQQQLRKAADIIDQIHFTQPPELHINIDGDAREINSFSARVLLKAPGARTAWGDFDDARFITRLLAATNATLSRMQGSLEAANARTPWADIEGFHLKFDLLSLPGQRVQASAELSAHNANTRWASGQNALLKANWTHALTNPIPLTGTADLNCDHLKSRWAQATHLSLSAQATRRDPSLTASPSHSLPVLRSPALREGTASQSVSPPSSQLSALNSLPSVASAKEGQLSFWTNLQPFDVHWKLSADGLHTEKASADHAQLEGHWHTPFLQVTNVEARLYGGRLTGEASLNIESRAASADLAMDADAQELKTVLTPGAQRWLNQFTWTNAPKATVTASLTLPFWTNSQPDWRKEVLPTLALDGQFHAPSGGTYRGAHVTSARGQFNYKNMQWDLPVLDIARPEGRVLASHRANDVTKDYYWKLHGAIDPQALRPLLGTNEQEILNYFTLTQPPHFSGEIWGRYRDYTRTGARLDVALTNFTFRNQQITAVAAALHYTNAVLAVHHPYLQQTNRFAVATNLVFHFNDEVAFLSNAWSNVDPMLIANAIGPKTAQTLEPYKFDSPPTGTAHGIIPLRGEEKADLYFELQGGPFHWWRFNVPLISGNLRWHGTNLDLANIRSDFYGGRAFCTANVQFLPGGHAVYNYTAWTTNVLLQFLAKDMWPHLTNRLEGYLSGDLVVTRADARDPKILDGYGNAQLRDGLLWDIPLFGKLSPLLNAITPGLGNNRASDASGNFTITNAVIHSDDIDIRSTGMRLAYRGTVDLDGAINARVEASILRDTWGVGSIVSTVLWPVSKAFEYKVTGSLGDPDLESVYLLPKLLSLPFLPFKAIIGPKQETPSQGTFAPITNGPTFEPITNDPLFAPLTNSPSRN